MQNNLLISQVYIESLPRLVGYISSRVGDVESARDIAQDVFVKILKADIVFLSKDAVLAVAFNIARRLMRDEYHHWLVVEKAKSQIEMDTPTWTVDTESGILARDIAALELRKLETLSLQRKTVYRLKRYEGLSNEEIAARLGITKRAVENLSLRACKQMRELMRMSV